MQRSDATHGLWCGSIGKQSDDARVRTGVGKSGDTAGTKEETKEKSRRQEKGSLFFSPQVGSCGQHTMKAEEKVHNTVWHQWDENCREIRLLF